MRLSAERGDVCEGTTGDENTKEYIVDNTYRTWLGEKIGEKCTENLKNNGFDAHFVPTRDTALSLILEKISNYTTYGFGGSDTVRSLGIIDHLKADGKILYDHNDDTLDLQKKAEYRLFQGRCDCFLCSANAISLKGEIVNVDGVGNRTSAMAFGPEKVIIVAGVNKITKDLETAISRVHEVAAPMRAKSLGIATPCAETGICSDCNSPLRICRITTILHKKPMMTDISVVLVNAAMGY